MNPTEKLIINPAEKIKQGYQNLKINNIAVQWMITHNAPNYTNKKIDNYQKK